MKGQTRLTFARVGVIDPLSLDDYRAHGGLVGLERAKAMTKAQIVAEAVAPGAVVADVARRWQVCPQQIFGWRRERRFVDRKFRTLRRQCLGECRNQEET